jgi:hypothetical protein
MLVVQRHLVQGLVLGFAQLYNTLHRVLRRNGSAEVNKIQTRLPATLRRLWGEAPFFASLAQQRK